MLTLSTGWLTPDSAQRMPGTGRVLLPTGLLWDCLRTPARLGVPVLNRLLADPADHALLGPVLWDDEADVLYWLVQRRHTDDYPAGVTLLRPGTWILAPDAGDVSIRQACWIHLPDGERLSGPAWLAAALRGRRAAVC